MGSILSNIKLSIEQYVGIMAAAAIGLLVLALRIKGSQLHKAQVDLLRSQYANALGKEDGLVAAARSKYLRALEDYNNEK